MCDIYVAGAVFRQIRSTSKHLKESDLSDSIATRVRLGPAEGRTLHGLLCPRAESLQHHKSTSSLLELYEALRVKADPVGYRREHRFVVNLSRAAEGPKRLNGEDPREGPLPETRPGLKSAAEPENWAQNQSPISKNDSNPNVGVRWKPPVTKCGPDPVIRTAGLEHREKSTKQAIKDYRNHRQTVSTTVAPEASVVPKSESQSGSKLKMSAQNEAKIYRTHYRRSENAQKFTNSYSNLVIESVVKIRQNVPENAEDTVRSNEKQKKVQIFKFPPNERCQNAKMPSSECRRACSLHFGPNKDDEPKAYGSHYGNDKVGNDVLCACQRTHKSIVSTVCRSCRHRAIVGERAEGSLRVRGPHRIVPTRDPRLKSALRAYLSALRGHATARLLRLAVARQKPRAGSENAEEPSDWTENCCELLRAYREQRRQAKRRARVQNSTVVEFEEATKRLQEATICIQTWLADRVERTGPRRSREIPPVRPTTVIHPGGNEYVPRRVIVPSLDLSDLRSSADRIQVRSLDDESSRTTFEDEDPEQNPMGTLEQDRPVSPKKGLDSANTSDGISSIQELVAMDPNEASQASSAAWPRPLGPHNGNTVLKPVALRPQDRGCGPNRSILEEPYHSRVSHRVPRFEEPKGDSAIATGALQRSYFAEFHAMKPSWGQEIAAEGLLGQYGPGIGPQRSSAVASDGSSTIESNRSTIVPSQMSTLSSDSLERQNFGKASKIDQSSNLTRSTETPNESAQGGFKSPPRCSNMTGGQRSGNMHPFGENFQRNEDKAPPKHANGLKSDEIRTLEDSPKLDLGLDRDLASPKLDLGLDLDPASLKLDLGLDLDPASLKLDLGDVRNWSDPADLDFESNVTKDDPGQDEFLDQESEEILSEDFPDNYEKLRSPTEECPSPEMRGGLGDGLIDKFRALIEQQDDEICSSELAQPGGFSESPGVSGGRNFGLTNSDERGEERDRSGGTEVEAQSQQDRTWAAGYDLKQGQNDDAESVKPDRSDGTEIEEFGDGNDAEIEEFDPGNKGEQPGIREQDQSNASEHEARVQDDERDRSGGDVEVAFSEIHSAGQMESLSEVADAEVGSLSDVESIVADDPKDPKNSKDPADTIQANNFVDQIESFEQKGEAERTSKAANEAASIHDENFGQGRNQFDQTKAILINQFDQTVPTQIGTDPTSHMNERVPAIGISIGGNQNSKNKDEFSRLKSKFKVFEFENEENTVETAQAPIEDPETGPGTSPSSPLSGPSEPAGEPKFVESVEGSSSVENPAEVDYFEEFDDNGTTKDSSSPKSSSSRGGPNLEPTVDSIRSDQAEILHSEASKYGHDRPPLRSRSQSEAGSRSSSIREEIFHNTASESDDLTSAGVSAQFQAHN